MSRPATGQVIVRRGKRGVSFALRFRAHGKREYMTLGLSEDGWTTKRAETELENVLADVRRGIWRPPEPAPLVEEPQPDPTFHRFASDWVDRRQHEVDARTSEHWRWALEIHLLPFFKNYRVSAINVEAVDTYRASKVREGTLSAGSVNKTLKILAQVLDAAVEYGYLDSNPARGRNRRLKASRPKRTWLELDEARALLEAAGDHRPLLATMILGGLRVGELTGLRWRDVDLARGRLFVREAKTDAGVREVDLSPHLREELTLHRADAGETPAAGYVFPSTTGTQLHRANVSNRILAKAIERANAKLDNEEKPPIVGVTNHSLRRTYASLLYEAGASPAYVMAQMGHTSSVLALEVYSKMMARERDTGARMDALIRGADWAQTGTSDETASPIVSDKATKNPA